VTIVACGGESVGGHTLWPSQSEQAGEQRPGPEPLCRDVVGAHLQEVGDRSRAAAEQRKAGKAGRQPSQNHQHLVVVTSDVGVLVGEHSGKLGPIQRIECARGDDDRVGLTGDAVGRGAVSLDDDHSWRISGVPDHPGSAHMFVAAGA
jgi:hypothetical protein